MPCGRFAAFCGFLMTLLCAAIWLAGLVWTVENGHLGSSEHALSGSLSVRDGAHDQAHIEGELICLPF